MRGSVTLVGQVVEREVDLILVLRTKLGVECEVKRGPAWVVYFRGAGIIFGAGRRANKDIGRHVSDIHQPGMFQANAPGQRGFAGIPGFYGVAFVLTANEITAQVGETAQPLYSAVNSMPQVLARSMLS